jgi:hypothetical protein
VKSFILTKESWSFGKVSCYGYDLEAFDDCGEKISNIDKVSGYFRQSMIEIHLLEEGRLKYFYTPIGKASNWL